MLNNSEIGDLFTNLANFQQTWYKNLVETNSTQNFQAPNEMGKACQEIYQNFYNNTKLYLELQNNFYHEQIKMWEGLFINLGQHKTLDKRFSDPEWNINPFFSYLKESYLNVSKYILELVDKSQMDHQQKERVHFFMRQYLDAIAPSNFAFTNPEVIKEVLATNGRSLIEGFKHMHEDMKKGYIAMTDESHFAVGENIAITAGSVIYRNNLIELIQYAPQTKKVHELPLLIVPPCINKFYILDLQPENSLVRYLVEKGITVYLLSWKSADDSIKTYNWDNYVEEGVISALTVIRAISGQDKINTVGYCIGGLILTTAALVLKARNLNYINTMAHLTTMLDHTNPGDIRALIDRDYFKSRGNRDAFGGIMSGRVISQTFSALRANELIWNYWVTKYLLGKTPHPFDILFWNSDAVDLPIPMHNFLMEKFYIDNDLIKGILEVCGIKMDLTQLNLPMYLFATKKDHIVPWQSAFRTLGLMKNSEMRFVLGASGHTAGVVNPVSINKRNFWINESFNEQLTKNSTQWFKNATEVSGSWWKDYFSWLSQHSEKLIASNRIMGNEDYQVLTDAPGEFVKARAQMVINYE